MVEVGTEWDSGEDADGGTGDGAGDGAAPGATGFALEVSQNRYLSTRDDVMDAVLTVTAHDPVESTVDTEAAEVVLLDCSGSMGTPLTKLLAAQQAAGPPPWTPSARACASRSCRAPTARRWSTPPNPGWPGWTTGRGPRPRPRSRGCSPAAAPRWGPG
nr:hypothetical protein GCM10020241_60210 [Streptoalloteichus tenebrarius]